jgi:hypothetical protein
LGPGVVRPDRNEIRTKGDAQTNKDFGFHEITHPGKA